MARLGWSIAIREAAHALSEKILPNLEHHEDRKMMEGLLRDGQSRIATARRARDSAMESVQMITEQYVPATTTPSENEETKYRQDLATLVWRPLIDSNVRFKVDLEPRQPLLQNFPIIARGHTHPLFLPRDLRYLPGKPSKTDETNGISQLVFAALPHELRIYTTVCGESSLARKYQRRKLE